MKFYVIESHALVVGWSPKCACTAVCDWLVHGTIKPITPVKGGARDYLRDNGFLRHSEEATSLILNDGFKPIFFVRNPATRLASGFIDKFVCRRGKPLTYPVNYEKLAINTITDLYETSHYTGDYQGVSFVDLLDYIDFCIHSGRSIGSPLGSAGIRTECSIKKSDSFRKLLRGKTGIFST